MEKKLPYLADIGNHRWKSEQLPSDHKEILARAVNPVVYSSNKELYSLLCNSILIDGGRKSFALDKQSGAKCYTLSARDLTIEWSNNEEFWKFVSVSESRFAEVAKVIRIYWLDIRGKIDSKELSSHTVYKAYLIFKLTPESEGLDEPPQEVLVSVGGRISKNEVRLQPKNRPVDSVPHERKDGWMEVEMGEFFNEDGSEGVVDMSFKEVNHLNCKKGLIVEGIQLRPK